MKRNSRVQALIFVDGLDTYLNRSCRLVFNLQKGVFLALQKSFREAIVSDPREILVVFSERSLHLAKTLGFDSFLRVTILLLKEGEYLSWTLLPQLDKQALTVVVLEWLKTIGVNPQTLILFQWQEADHVMPSFLSTASDSEITHNYVNPALLITAGSILAI